MPARFPVIFSSFFLYVLAVPHFRQEEPASEESVEDIEISEPAVEPKSADTNAAKGGIVIEETDLVVDSCLKSLKTHGSYIVDLENYSIRDPGVIVGNAYAISLFKSDSPDSLVTGMDLTHIGHIGTLFGAPECLKLKSSVEGK